MWKFYEQRRPIFKYILETADATYFYHPINTKSQPRKTVRSAFLMAYSDIQPKEPVPPGVVSFHLLGKHFNKHLNLSRQ